MKQMIAIVLLAGGLWRFARARSIQRRPAQVQPTGVYARPGIPQSQYECVTDDGYGRSRPCSDSR